MSKLKIYFTDDERKLITQLDQAFASTTIKQLLIDIKGKSLVIFIGPTGSGKSTVVNYYLGTRYTTVGREGFDLHASPTKDSTPERAKVGHNVMKSETLYPAVFNVTTKNYVLCDFAGMEETRGKTEAIIGSGAAHMLVKGGAKVKRIVLVLDIESIVAQKGNKLQEALLMLNQVLGEVDDKKLDIVTFAITKIPSTITREAFIQTYIKPKAKLLQLRQEQEELKASDKAILTICEYILKFQKQLVIADTCDQGESAKDLMAQIDSSSDLAVSAINIFQQDKESIEFVEWLHEKVEIFNEALKIIEGLTERLTKRQSQCENIQQEIKSQEKELAAKIEVNTMEVEAKRKEAQEFDIRIKGMQTAIADKHGDLGKISGNINVIQAEITRLKNSAEPKVIYKADYKKEPEFLTEKHERCKRFMGICYGHYIVERKVPKNEDTTKKFIYGSVAPIIAVKLNGANVSAVITNDGKHVEFEYTHSLGRGAWVNFEVYVKESDLPATANFIGEQERLLESLIKIKSETGMTIHGKEDELSKMQANYAMIVADLNPLIATETQLALQTKLLQEHKTIGATQITMLEKEVSADQEHCNGLKTDIESNFFTAILPITRIITGMQLPGSAFETFIRGFILNPIFSFSSMQTELLQSHNLDLSYTASLSLGSNLDQAPDHGIPKKSKSPNFFVGASETPSYPTPYVASSTANVLTLPWDPIIGYLKSTFNHVINYATANQNIIQEATTTNAKKAQLLEASSTYSVEAVTNLALVQVGVQLFKKFFGYGSFDDNSNVVNSSKTLTAKETREIITKIDSDLNDCLKQLCEYKELHMISSEDKTEIESLLWATKSHQQTLVNIKDDIDEVMAKEELNCLYENVECLLEQSAEVSDNVSKNIFLNTPMQPMLFTSNKICLQLVAVNNEVPIAMVSTRESPGHDYTSVQITSAGALRLSKP